MGRPGTGLSRLPASQLLSRILRVIARSLRGVARWREPCIPEYKPDQWNDGGAIQCLNNCYNYACDLRTDTYAQPGRPRGQSWDGTSVPTCSDMGPRSTLDGLTTTTDGDCSIQGCCHLVALVVGQHDYHWYRRDRVGRWSHKPGKDAVRDVDDLGLQITDPEVAVRVDYPDFCGYYCVCKGQINIE
jgi:hypothetical protein